MARRPGRASWFLLPAFVGLGVTLLAGCMTGQLQATQSTAADQGRTAPCAAPPPAFAPNIIVLPSFTEAGAQQAARLHQAVEGIPAGESWASVHGSTYRSAHGTYEVGGLDPRGDFPHLVTYESNEEWSAQRVAAVAQGVYDAWEVPAADQPHASVWSNTTAGLVSYKGMQPAPYFGQLEIFANHAFKEELPVVQVFVDALYKVETQWPVTAGKAREIAAPVQACLLHGDHPGVAADAAATSEPELRNLGGRATYTATRTIADRAPCGSAEVSVDAVTGNVLRATYRRGIAYPIAPCEGESRT